MPSSAKNILSLHDALPIFLETGEAASLLAQRKIGAVAGAFAPIFRCASSRSEEHTSELQSLRHLVCRLRRRTFFPYTTLFRSFSKPAKRRRYSRSERSARSREHSRRSFAARVADRKSTRLNSSHLGISYAVFGEEHSFPTRRSSDLSRNRRSGVATRAAKDRRGRGSIRADLSLRE